MWESWWINVLCMYIHYLMLYVQIFCAHFFLTNWLRKNLFVLVWWASFYIMFWMYTSCMHTLLRTPTFFITINLDMDKLGWYLFVCPLDKISGVVLYVRKPWIEWQCNEITLVAGVVKFGRLLFVLLFAGLRRYWKLNE